MKYINIKSDRFFGLQHKPSWGEKHKRIVTNEGLKFEMRDNDWLFRTKLQV